ncbi:MAG: PEP-CTERM sorting domain-containing protein [Fimbriimonadales bacterium]|nr:PEP-CTERM sorting domain-containing protein [Fimbriimonadales bacterium]
MKKSLWISAAVGLASAGHSAVLFSSLVKDGNTGHDGSAVITYSNADDDWALVSRPSAPNQLQHAVVKPASGWLGDTQDYRWIGAESARGFPGADVPGDYVYRLQIDLPGSFDPSSQYAQIDGRFASDNVGYLFLKSYSLGPGYNGHLVNNSGATPSTSGGWTSFSLIPTLGQLSGTAGNYSLDLFFVVNNAGSSNSEVGLLVQFQEARIQSIPVVPEPATLALGAGALAAALARRRRR